MRFGASEPRMAIERGRFCFSDGFPFIGCRNDHLIMEFVELIRFVSAEVDKEKTLGRWVDCGISGYDIDVEGVDLRYFPPGVDMNFGATLRPVVADIRHQALEVTRDAKKDIVLFGEPARRRAAQQEHK